MAKNRSRSILTVLAVIAIIAGVWALVDGGFSYPGQTHRAELGPLKLEAQETERIDVPTWAAIALIAGGVGTILAARR